MKRQKRIWRKKRRKIERAKIIVEVKMTRATMRMRRVKSLRKRRSREK